MTQTNEYAKDIFGGKDNYEQRQIQYLLKENKGRQRRLKKEIRTLEEEIISSTIFNGRRLENLKEQLQTVERQIESIEKEEKN